MTNLTINFSAENTDLLNLTGKSIIPSGTIGYVKADFSLGENWTDFDAVKAVWSAGSVTASMLLLNNSCEVPHEVLDAKGTVRVNLAGYVAEGDTLVERLTTFSVVALTVGQNVQIDGMETEPSVVKQFEKLATIAVEAKDRAIEAADGVEEYAASAAESAEEATVAAGTAVSKAAEASTSAGTATAKASEASQSASSAASSAEAAATSKEDAEGAAETATTKAGEASQSASEASTSAGTATQAAETAVTKAAEASTSAGTATAKASEASQSASSAASSAEAAATSKEDAEGAAETATTKAGEASQSASEASTSAGTATQAAETAVSKAAEASTSAGTATAKASEASQSASSAAGSAEDAADSAEDSEAWAVGKRGGSDVPSTDPQYNNNAKYWAEQAQDAAFGTVDTEMSDSSTNPVRNNVIKNYVDTGLGEKANDEDLHTVAKSGDYEDLENLPFIPSITETGATITAAGWDEGSQEVSVQGVTMNNMILITPDPESLAAYSECGVYCTSRAAGKLTFSWLYDQPETDISVNIAIFE